MKKNNDKSLFLYTALIFFVAIILIIIAFFGQTNVERSQPLPQATATQSPVTGLTEKASLLSEENARLIQESLSLKEEITSRDEEIAALNAQIEAMNIQNENDNLIFHAFNAFLSGNDDDYTVIMNNINYDSLTPEQKTIYDELKNKKG